MANVLTVCSTREGVTFTLQNASGVGTPLAFVNVNGDQTWTIGNTAGEANKGHRVTQNINANSSLTIDLTSYTDLLGGSASMTALKYVRLNHDPASTSTGIEVVGNATNAVGKVKGGSYSPGQGGILFEDLSGNGSPVNSTLKNLVVKNDDASNAAMIDLVLLGSS